MIKTRLVGLLSHAKKYIVYTILWQWAALLSQVLAVFTIADLLERVVYRAVTVPVIEKTIMILALVVTIRFVCERMGARSSYLACVDVKRILREKIYDKMLKLGASYSEQVSSSEVVQVSTEGVEQLDKVINIDQSPIGRTPRSNPATYTGVFTDIRALFATTQDAKMKGFSQSRFSFNVKGGRCEACQGDGIIKIEMHFLSDVYVPCEVCKGKRYNRETLEVKYKGMSINDVLEMTAEEGMEFFANIPRIYRKLKTLCDVGLGYIKIGQPATTLSGGEAQRVKLATELAKRPTGKTVYILDEPTTGLHIADVHRLIDVLQQLVDTGNTVVVIEHNLDLIKTADHIIDLGPEGGDMGGTVIAEGTPEEVAKNKNSFTGQYLKPFLNMN